MRTIKNVLVVCRKNAGEKFPRIKRTVLYLTICGGVPAGDVAWIYDLSNYKTSNYSRLVLFLISTIFQSER